MMLAHGVVAAGWVLLYCMVILIELLGSNDAEGNATEWGDDVVRADGSVPRTAWVEFASALGAGARE